MPPLREVDVSPDEGYRLFRGRCLEMSEALAAADPSLRVVRGHYFCPIWNRTEPHWWCVKPNGTIVDPTARQFPSAGMGEYTEFDGRISCAECGRETTEDKAVIHGNYACCSERCMLRLVGL